MLRKYLMLGLVVGAVAGCATMRESRRKSQTEQDQINAAFRAKDAISLEEWTTAATFLRNREMATEKFVELRLQLLATADCAAFEAAFQPRPVTATNMQGGEWQPSTMVSFGNVAPADKRETIAQALLAKGADCTSAKVFSARFRSLTRDDDAQWARRLVALEKKGRPLYEAFRVMLSAGDLSDFEATATYQWLLASKTAIDCKSFEEAAADNNNTRSFLLGFYARKGCAEEGVRAARALVTAQSPELRGRACTLMSMMGNTSLLPQMKVLAASDPAKNVDPTRRRGADAWVSFPVRETCQTAIDELRVKALTTQR
ncbi:MAG: hypothetical protein ACKV2T_40535 [Kofleriaceae bacterium]